MVLGSVFPSAHLPLIASVPATGVSVCLSSRYRSVWLPQSWLIYRLIASLCPQFAASISTLCRLHPLLLLYHDQRSSRPQDLFSCLFSDSLWLYQAFSLLAIFLSAQCGGDHSSDLYTALWLRCALTTPHSARNFLTSALRQVCCCEFCKRQWTGCNHWWWCFWANVVNEG